MSTDKNLDKKSDQKSKIKIKSWYSNRYQIVVVQRNILLLFTLVSMFSVAVAVIFVKTIMSSKSLEPYVIEVEQKTGIPTVVDQLTAQSLTGDQMIRRYFLNQFIHSYFGYDSANVKVDSDKVRLFSTPNVFLTYRKEIVQKFQETQDKSDIRIKSIQFPDANSAQIRFLQQIESKTGVSEKNLLVNLNFNFIPENNLDLEERLINPLGFQVNKITTTEENF